MEFSFFKWLLVLCALHLSRLSVAYAQATPIQLLDTSQFAPGTFFSVIFDKNSQSHAWAMPSEGALYIDGRPVEEEKLVPHTRGHKVLRNLVQSKFPEFKNKIEWAGGGFKLNNDRSISFGYVSRSINGDDGKLSPAMQEKLRAFVNENLGIEIDSAANHGYLYQDHLLRLRSPIVSESGQPERPTSVDFLAWLEVAHKSAVHRERIRACQDAMSN